MLSRSLSVIPVARKALSINSSAASLLSRKTYHDGPPANYRFPTMDDMPVPCGCWQEDYDNKQKKYNAHLIFGVGFFIVTLGFGIYSGILNTYNSPPARPAPRI